MPLSGFCLSTPKPLRDHLTELHALRKKSIAPVLKLAVDELYTYYLGLYYRATLPASGPSMTLRMEGLNWLFVTRRFNLPSKFPG